jgi:hypothetical protein
MSTGNNRATAREYRAFPRPVDDKPRARHGRSADDDTPQRERILRPLDSAPRRAQDWS